mmetsp:Transcript_2645/g.5582  ORF Transcript_2645/g.5582 Transcript_2645/m.5582 type:complete len:211 (-) Transcript_2645:20-652(-)
MISFLFLIATLALAARPSAAFVASSLVSSRQHRILQSGVSTPTSAAGPLFSEESSGGGLFGGLFGGKKADPNEPKELFNIPLESIKSGGLRLALSLHCIGQQNTPDKGTWLANQADDGVIEMWYNPDQSGMFSVTLSEEDGGGILVERHGPAPSLVYQLQESLQLHKLLDEIEVLAIGNEEEIEDENRLLVLKDKDGIDKARATLPARNE